MRKSLLVSGLVLCLSSPVFGVGNLESVPDELKLMCIPGKVEGDNPAIKIHIGIHFSEEEAKIKSMYVNYELFNGEKVYRGQQYNVDDVSQIKKGMAAWGWHGVLKKDSKLSEKIRREMVGIIYYTGMWNYKEQVIKGGKIINEMNTRSCNSVELSDH